ncbi:MAG: ATP-dependent RecD-like DNA helicase [Desulfovibrio sp.]|jgi:exodeoxyribonuclease V alpha subunit|nr:ATP-dependent RecD-like DNA helicase [Desulfovibrio sp.]
MTATPSIPQYREWAKATAATRTELRGQLERITYVNEENGYLIGRLKVHGQKGLVTIVGNIPNPTPGQMLKLVGEWTNHPKFGEQFKIDSYECTVPATVKGIEKYLGSGLIKGIGPVTARRIVEVFGTKTLDIIEKSCARLSEVPGIGASKAALIARAWEEQRGVRDIMIFLQGHGISAAYAAKIYKLYGSEAIAVVRENPYQLAYDVRGIGFVSADRIARSLGFDLQCPERAQAGLVYVLDDMAGDGHVFAQREHLLAKAAELLAVESDILEDALASLAAGSQKIVLETLADGDREIEAVYLAPFRHCEGGAASMLQDLLRHPRSMRTIDVTKALAWVQGQLSITLAERQLEAVDRAATRKCCVITGGPGTGKTTIIKAILAICSRLTKRILLTAPTGRAAKRMSETTGMEARTIHRLLEYSVTQGGFQRNEDNMLAADLIIVDECSMIDLVLFYHLLKAIPRTATLVLVGDADQLPSVGAGSVLKDVIASGVVPVVTLNEIFRQAASSSIVVNAHRIIKGDMPTFPKGRDTDFFLFPAEEPEATQAMVVDVVRNRIPRQFGLSPLQDVQVLTPMNRGVLGTATLNERLQAALNPNGLEISRFGRTYRIGDKVMQIKNNYDKDVYNGDIGIVADIDQEAQNVKVTMDGRDVLYDYAELDELVLAYAVSIHKSQGSEYPAVVLPVSTQHYVMLQRNLLYTGVTRGKRLVVLVGDMKALSIAVRNNRLSMRNSWLAHRLRG